MSANRIPWVDVLRGYAMIWIALGHCLLGLTAANAIDPNGWARDAILFIYLFQMPIIFFVSGYVSRDADRSLNDLAWSLGQWIVAPYVIWSAILVFVQNFAPGANAPVPPAALLEIAWKPIALFWFLYALFVIKTADFALSRLLPSSRHCAILLTAVGAIGFVAAQALALPMSLPIKILSCAYFYGLGRLYRQNRQLLEALMAKILQNTGVLVGAVAACALGLIALALYYVSWPAGLLQPLAEPQGLFIPSGTLGILLFLLLAQWSAGSRLSQPVAVVGVYSMVVYVQHVVVGAGMRALLMKAHVANAPALILLVLGASLALPVVWQKTTDFLGVTRIFGIRPIANPGWPLAIRAPEES